MTTVYRSAEGAVAVRQRYDTLLRRWPVPHETRTLATRLGDTFAVVSGPVAAPPLVALQGSGGTAAHWLPDIATLAEHLRVHAVDAPGEPGRTQLREALPGADVRPAEDAGHFLPGWAAAAAEFLKGEGS
ncbi:hypothetical protein OG738_23670 [Amycolatopsis sp. NBC_01488]|uniref:alpha/beta fold hydrolase n=1 Tax=Amycolatopsis sp. NBC_01488 TaxID=2903563 RepID=UPI002E29A15E|nr:hypothetical protein [Amycolatopsis sp. NBC_01488]